MRAPYKATVYTWGRERLISRFKGNGSSWGFGMPVNGAPGLPTPQARPTNAATTSFAQTIGGSQPATPLDLSYVYRDDTEI